MPGPLHHLVEEWKSISGPVQWSSPPAVEDGVIQFLVPLEIGELTIAGFALRGVAYAYLPDEAVTLQMEISQNGARTRIPLARLDWKPRSAFHQNPDKSRFAGTHIHPFDLNWLEVEQRMRTGNLPFAQKIVQIHTFNDMLDYAKAAFRIKDVDKIPMPEWSRQLL